MKRCPSCQTFQEVAAKFCSHCGHSFGAAVGPATAATPVRPAPQPAPRPAVQQVAAPVAAGPAQYGTKQTKWLWGVAAVAIVLALGFGANGLLRSLAQDGAGLSRTTAKDGSGLTKTTAQDNTGLTQQVAETDSGLTRQVAEPAAGVSRLETPPPPEAKKMPDDIRAYLEHVRETERRRFELATQNLADLKVKMAQLGAAGGMNALKHWLGEGGEGEGGDVETPAAELAAEAGEMRKDWDRLATFFQSVPPPRRCFTLRDRYDVALTETGASISDVMALLAGAQQDPQAAVATLERMKGTSKNIDSASRDSNGEVRGICNEYDVRPWFEIQSDYGGGGFLSGLGL